MIPQCQVQKLSGTCTRTSTTVSSKTWHVTIHVYGHDVHFKQSYSLIRPHRYKITVKF